ncbi:MAG: nickel-dependent hydrogenase large subunit [Acidobacteriota bacterium]|nr:MAG: nickel-dependent hydrogenase large subunit [Acidobacteriota bacterium]
MVFKNLPIEMDARGQARLRVGEMADPFGLKDMLDPGRALRQPQGAPPIEGQRPLEDETGSSNAQIIRFEPLTRSSRRISFKALIDFDQRRVLDARVGKNEYWGLDLTVLGSNPSDAVQLTSRMSGIGSGANAIASCLALEMAFGISPPPLAIVTRGLGAAAELIGAHTRHLFLQAGVDYSEAAVSRTSFAVWELAQSAMTERAEIHGYETVADLMRQLNPVSGHLYREALHLMRTAHEVATLIFGKYPHPSSIFPGGVGIEANKEVFNQILGRINQLIDYAKKVTAVWDDLADFFNAAEPRFGQVGQAPSNLLSTGIWDDPRLCDCTFAGSSDWGEHRLSTPGVVVNGRIRTSRLVDLNAGIEQFPDRSFFEQWQGHPFEADPLGTPLSPLHPWNKQTIPAPSQNNWNGCYSWETAARWDREPVETGPLARQWVTATAGKLNTEFMQASGGRIEIDLPRFQMPAQRLTWRQPAHPNALERNRARAYHIGYCGMIALTYLLRAFNCLQKGDKEMSTPWRTQQKAIGVGFWEDSAGALVHHLEIADGRIANYQILTASSWLGSPQDSLGRPGPCEQALINTPLLEQFRSPEDFTGIDLLRAIRSFDL